MWHLVDAKDKLVGRIATQIAPILRGKHKPTFSPNYDCGDYIVIINAQHCKLTGNKDKQKTYSWHTGFPGGIKHTNPATLRGDGKAEEVGTISYSHKKHMCFLTSLCLFLVRF